jgi:hypothetical protein
MTNEPDVKLRRIYDQPTRKDGTRVLVDRVWQRVLSKGEARIEWFKQVAPSTKLRKWCATTQIGSLNSPAATCPSSKIPSERRPLPGSGSWLSALDTADCNPRTSKSAKQRCSRK